MKAHHWKDIPERGSQWGVALLRGVMRVGGLPAMRVVLLPVAFYYLLTHSTARAASRDYLSRLEAYCAKHGLKCHLRANWRGVYRHIYSFAISMAEKYAAWNGRYAGSKAIHVEDLKASRRVTHGRRGVVLLASHLGNFDISIAVGAFDTSRRFRILIDHASMRRFNRLRFSAMHHEQIMFHDAEDVGPETALELRQAIAGGDIVVLAADRLGHRRGESVDVRLLDGQAPVPVGPWIVAHLLRCPVYAVFACRDGDRHHMIPFHICERVVLGDRTNRRKAIQTYAQQFADCMERIMLRYPEQWYNFFQYWHEEQ